MSAQLLKLETSPDLVDQVYRRLLDAIGDGSLAPGARITQEELAAQLDVSRQPVLLALRLLKKDGFLHDAPGRGVRVAPLDADWLRQVYQVRGALDALAARLAAQRHFVVPARLIAQGRKAARGKNVVAMMDADMAFHEAIYEASGNPLLGQSARQHWQHLRRAMGAVLRQSGQRESLWGEHVAIAEAIASGDAGLAARLAECHALEASEGLARDMKQLSLGAQS